MATAFTSLLGLALPVTGELAGTWGDTVNNSITSLLDSAVAGTTTLSTDADVTLTTLTGASNQARQAILRCSGARTVLRTITAPAQSKMYVVINNTTGGFGVKIVGVGPTTGVTVANGKTAVVVWNGTDFVEVAPAVATNLSGGTAGAVPYQTAANTTTFLAIGAANYVLTSTGAAPTWTLNTGTGSVVRATSPTLVTPLLGTPQSGTLTNCTGLPISTGVSGLGAGIATFLATPSSANLAAAVTDETGTGALVFGTSPTLATPTFTTSATFPLHIGGTGTTSTLTLRSTSGVGTTGADIIFQTGNNGATEAARILNNGRVGINTTAPQALFHVSVDGNGALFTRDGTSSVVARSGYDTDANGSFFIGQRARTSVASPSIVNSGDRTIEIWGRGYDGAAYQSAGRITIDVDAAPGAGSMPGRMVFFTTPSASTTPSERMRIDSAGRVLVGTATASGSQMDIVDATGANNRSLTISRSTTDAAAKSSAISIRHWLNAEEPVSLIGAGVDDNVNSLVRIGGGFSNLNAATAVAFFTASDNITLTGSERMRITSTGDVGVGTTSPTSKLTVDGTFNTTGNATLGGATTDTVTVSGYMAVGSTPVASQGLRVVPIALTGTFQFGSVLSLTATSAATAGVEGARVQAGTAAAAFTTGYAAGLWVRDALRGAGSTITNNYGIFIDEKVAGTNNYGLATNIAAGANKWNLHIDGTAASYFAGNVGVGTTSPTSPLTIGTATAIGLLINGQTTGASYISITNTGGAYVAGVNNNTGNAVTNGLAYSSFVGTNNATALQLTTNGAVRATVDSSGNVGIGTASPTTKLQVVGPILTANGSNYVSNTLTRTDQSGVGNTDSLIMDIVTGTGYARLANYDGTNVQANIQLYRDGTTRILGGATEFVRINGSGEVGIGVTPISGVKLAVGVATGTATQRLVTGSNNDISLQVVNSTCTTVLGTDSVGSYVGSFTAAKPLLFYTASSERMRIDSAGNVLVGASSTVNNSKMLVAGVTGNTPLVVQGSASNSAVAAFYNSAATTNRFVIGQGYVTGSDNIAFLQNDANAALVFGTNAAERMRITSTGDVLVTGIGGLGYGTGSGGAVTQTISRTTGVTLDKTNGAITLFSAAGTTAWQSFTVTNNKVVATDVVKVCQKSGTDLYQIFVTAVAAGSFRISFATTGGTTTEQPVFNFAVIKAVTA